MSDPSAPLATASMAPYTGIKAGTYNNPIQLIVNAHGCLMQVNTDDGPFPRAECEQALKAPDSGVDAGAYINAAIAELAAKGGGTLCLEPGLYTLDTSVLPLSNVDIKGAGTATVLKWRDGHDGTHILFDKSLISFIDANAVADVSIYNLTLDGNFANVTNTHHGVRVDQAQNIRLYNLNIQDTELDGVYLIDTLAIRRTQNVKIYGLTITSPQRSGVVFISCADVEVWGCRTIDPLNTHYDIEPDLATEHVERLTVASCVGIDTAAMWCIGVTVNQLGLASDITFTNCTFDSAGEFGNIGDTGGTVRRIIVDGVTAQTNTTAGQGSLWIIGVADSVEVSDSEIGIKSWGVNSAACRVNCTGRVEISDCLFVGDPTSGGAPRSSVSISNNGKVSVRDCDCVGTVLIADQTNGVSGVEFLDNRVDMLGTTTQMALDIAYASRCRFVGNRIVGGDYGVRCTSDAGHPLLDVDISANWILDWRRRGISLADTTSAILRVYLDRNVIYTANTGSIFGMSLQSAPVFCRNNTIEINGTAGAVGGAGIVGSNNNIITGNTVRHGAAQFSIQVGGNSTGYVCSENNTVINPTLTGIPARASNNALIAA